MFKKKKNDPQAKNEGHGKETREISDEDLGKRVGTVFHEAMVEIAQLLGPKPDISLVRQPVYDLKERVIKELLPLGKMREARDEMRRKTIDAKIGSMLLSVDMKAFQVMQESVTFYRPKDNDMANAIASFNIITQYASFDLLKKQAPKEAGRLGIA